MSIHGEDDRSILSDGELRLRPARLPEDIELAGPWYSDPEVMLFSEGDASARYDNVMIGKMYDYLAALGELYIIELWVNDGWLAIGDVALANETLPIVIGVAKFRSRGYGKRVIKMLIERARSLGWLQMKVKKIATRNLRSRKLFESLGFVQVGDAFLEEGEFCFRYVKQL